MRWLLAALIAVFISSAQADQPLIGWQLVNSTPSISLTVNATSNTILSHRGPVNYIAIKNDCSGDMHFGFNTPLTASHSDYPIRLKSGESFDVPVKVWNLGASAASINGGTCTFTLFLAR